jgi:RNA polymerase sigma-70 factor (ECF subfamily)
MERADRLSALFEAHADRLYRLARRLVPTADDALDLVQETFLRAARSPRSVPLSPTEAEAWLVRVLVNIRRDEWRREAVRARHQPVASDASSHVDAERALVARDTVWKALDHLSPRRRSIVILAELEGLSIAAIASLLGVSAITVRWHLARGRRELARRIRVEAGVPDEQPEEPVAGQRSAASRARSL